jgi:periplasmic protein TonB
MAEETIRPLMYRPPAPWFFWGALGVALAAHLTAVALAQKREQPAEIPPDIPTAIVEATLQATEEPTPPPEDIPLPEPPPPPDIKPEYVEETTPPPKRPQQAQKFTPIKAPQAAGRPGTLTASGAKAAALYAPKPEYPYEARSRHVTGSGVCVVDVDPSSGNVTSASMGQSTGNPILDNATVSAFRRWRFKPGSASKARIPITFTMTGASY